jgi:hypothetical protein
MAMTLGVGFRHEVAQVAQGRRVAGELVVVEQRPAQDLAPLVIVLRAELAECFGQVVEDHAGLRIGPAAMFEQRHLAHHIERAVLRRLRLALEEIHEARLPVGTRPSASINAGL